MSQILVPIQLQDEVTSAWVQNSLKGFVSQSEVLMNLLSFDADAEGFQVFGKSLLPPVKKTTATAAAPAAAPVVFDFNNQAQEKAKLEAAKVEAAQTVDALNDSVNELNLSTSSADTNPSTSGADSLENSTEEADTEADGELDLSTMNEYDVVHGLKVLYVEKNGCQPKDAEVAQWLAALRAQKAETEPKL
jgi:hypothetical protein